jgi:hypothetical protein
MKQNMFINYKKTNFEQYHFGNEWGLFVDIENAMNANLDKVGKKTILCSLEKIDETIEYNKYKTTNYDVYDIYDIYDIYDDYEKSTACSLHMFDKLQICSSFTVVIADCLRAICFISIICIFTMLI